MDDSFPACGVPVWQRLRTAPQPSQWHLKQVSRSCKIVWLCCCGQVSSTGLEEQWWGRTWRASRSWRCSCSMRSWAAMTRGVSEVPGVGRPRSCSSARSCARRSCSSATSASLSCADTQALLHDAPSFLWDNCTPFLVFTAALPSHDRPHCPLSRGRMQANFHLWVRTPKAEGNKVKSATSGTQDPRDSSS